MKWVFFLFRRITELVTELDGKKTRKILNLGENI
jgi:transposase